MKELVLEKYGVYRVELPNHPVTRKQGKKAITVNGSEWAGPHPCVVINVNEDGQSAIVCPLTSAQDRNGGEKYFPGSVKKIMASRASRGPNGVHPR